VRGRASAFELLKRPETSLAVLEDAAARCGLALNLPPATARVEHEARERIEVTAVYDGYLQRQAHEAQRAKELESLTIPAAFDYGRTKGLSYESVEKLSRVRPTTVGQASRVPGVRPSDIALLIGHLRNDTARGAN
jgi:tRNA uridine 5-carboxymethylaminomethyl modification enzyme